MPRAALQVAAFFVRDVRLARSYHAAFGLEVLQALFSVASFHFLARYVESGGWSGTRGPRYFAFALVGLAFFDYLAVSLAALEGSVEEARSNGTLEAVLVTQASLPVMLIGSVLYHFTLTAIRTAVYVLWGVLLFDFPWRTAHWGAALVVLLVSIGSFIGLGVLSVSFLLVYKRGNPGKWLIVGLAGLVSGVMYPVSVLPEPLQWLAWLLPITYSLEAMRGALLGGAGLAELWPLLRALLLFAVVLLPLSFAAFGWALRRTRIDGTLTHF